MDQQIKEAAQAWIANPHYSWEARKEIQDLMDAQMSQELTDRFYKDLEFGTGGMRGVIGMGRNRINRYTVRKAALAVAHVLLQQHTATAAATSTSTSTSTSTPTSTPTPTPTPTPIKVAISYDSRQFSYEFAQESAIVLAAHGIHAHIFKAMMPVPLLSYAVRTLGAKAGMMITASHNPKKYNGLKVYGEDGSQVIPPMDEAITDAYYNPQITDLGKLPFLTFSEGMKRGLIHWIEEDLLQSYLQLMLQNSLQPSLCREKGSQLHIVYTPLHGTGYFPCTQILKQLGNFQLSVVQEQIDPSCNFATVDVPNPEDPQALAMACQMLREKNADLAFATDPDADRLGVVVQHQGEQVFLNGNQMGVLLFYYILQQRKQQHRWPQQQALLVKSIVTTNLLDAIAADFGVHVEKTLTGFKWICGRMRELEESKAPYTFTYACEESFGYLVHDLVRDKDAVSALAMMSEMALFHKLKGQTLVHALEEIYQKYGFYYESLLSLTFEGKEGSEKISRIMDFFRQSHNMQGLPGEDLLQVEDYQQGWLLSQGPKGQGQERHQLHLPSSNVLGLGFASGNKLYLRPSGTEPKIKFYFMLREVQGTLAEKKRKAMDKAAHLEQHLRQLVKNI